jgi:hypothetical protein
MARGANAIDFWRGFALVSIFINHIPGIVYERLTHRNLSLSDSAELFVFLAGWSLRQLVGRASDPLPIDQLVLRLTGRAVVIYAAHITIVMIAIALLAASAKWFDNPLLLEWHNASAVFSDPANTHIGLVLLSHQLGYFDILPLYVLLMMLAPLIAIIHRLAPAALLPLSLAVYFSALVVPITVPTWPVPGQWFFNPFCWQLIFVLGFSLARERGVGGWVSRNIVPIRVAALPVLLVCTWMVVTEWVPDPDAIPEPRLLFIAGKTFATPIRVIQFLALIAVFSIVFSYIHRWLPWLVDWWSMLGRHSLNVFCVGSVLSLVGQIVRYQFGGTLLIDTAIVIVGVAALSLTAWLADSRNRGSKVRV